MAVKQVLPRQWEGLEADPKPTTADGVVAVSSFRETDTDRLWITYDGDNWIVADLRVRLVGEDGSFLALDEQLDDLLGNLAVMYHHLHSRMRVYPQDVGAAITLACTATANTFGSWTQIIPLNTVDFMYMVKGIVIEVVNAATTYLIQLGYSITDGDDPTDAQILGERRLLLPSPPVQATELLEIAASHCPVNAKLWGRLKSASGAADQAEISVVVTRHTEITNPPDHLTTWPWST